jgi:hypothetical protein
MDRRDLERELVGSDLDPAERDLRAGRLVDALERAGVVARRALDPDDQRERAVRRHDGSVPFADRGIGGRGRRR